MNLLRRSPVEEILLTPSSINPSTSRLSLPLLPRRRLFPLLVLLLSGLCITLPTRLDRNPHSHLVNPEVVRLLLSLIVTLLLQHTLLILQLPPCHPRQLLSIVPPCTSIDNNLIFLLKCLASIPLLRMDLRSSNNLAVKKRETVLDLKRTNGKIINHVRKKELVSDMITIATLSMSVTSTMSVKNLLHIARRFLPRFLRPLVLLRRWCSHLKGSKRLRNKAGFLKRRETVLQDQFHQSLGCQQRHWRSAFSLPETPLRGDTTVLNQVVIVHSVDHLLSILMLVTTQVPDLSNVQ